MLRNIASIFIRFFERRERIVLTLGFVMAIVVNLRTTWTWSIPPYVVHDIVISEERKQAWIWASPHSGAKPDSDSIYVSLLVDSAFTGSLFLWMRERRKNRQVAREWRRRWATTQEVQKASLLRASQPPVPAHDTLVRPATVSAATDPAMLLRISQRTDPTVERQ